MLMKTVLITGDKGFIGSRVSEFLRTRGFGVTTTGTSSETDLCNLSQVLTLPASDIIIHLAARSFVPDAFNRPAEFYRNNFLSTLNILELAKKNNSRLIFFSTYVYGIPCYLPINEDHPVSPLNPYTQSKLICEDLCKSYSRDFKVPVVIFRPFNVYGPGQKEPFIIPKIIGQLNNKAIQLIDPLPKRDFIFVDDIIEAVYRAVLTDLTGIGVFNVGSGTSVSVNELAQLIIEIAQSKSSVIYSNTIRQGEIQETIADISKIQAALNWSPKTSLREGLLKTIQGFATS